MVTAVKRPAGETRGKVAAGPDTGTNTTAPAPDPTATFTRVACARIAPGQGPHARWGLSRWGLR